jgi:hypothetical protein
LAAIGIWTYVSLYSADKSLQNSALISRLTFQLLKNQPETVVPEVLNVKKNKEKSLPNLVKSERLKNTIN